MRLRRVLGLAGLVAILWPAAASARLVDCRPPFGDALRKAICSNAERRDDEKRLSDTADALLLLADESRRGTFEAEQSDWERERHAACAGLPDHEIRTCHYQYTEPRLQTLEAELGAALRGEVLTLADRKLELRDAVRFDPVTVVTQLRYRGHLLAETLDRDGFDEVARHGDASREAVVLRGRRDGAVYALTASAGAPPEIWRLRSSLRPQPPLAIESRPTGLVIEETTVPGVGRTAARWTPTDGWRTIARPHVPQRPPQSDALDVPNPNASALPGEPVARSILTLGTRQLELLDYDAYPPHVLAQDGRAIVEGGPNPFTISAPETIGDTTVIFVLAYNAGNGGCVAQYLIADTPGQPLRRWQLDLCRPFERQRTADGYVLLTEARPEADGIRYRWTPSAGLVVESFFPFQPQAGTRITDLGDGGDTGTIWGALGNEELFRGLAVAAGPSLSGLAESFYKVHKLESPPEMLLYTNCSPTRFCRPEINSIAALHQPTGKLYFALAPPQPVYAYRPPGTPDPEAGLVRPVEYHPPLELWPSGVVEALSSARP
jgi:hypothetical protein